MPPAPTQLDRLVDAWQGKPEPAAALPGPPASGAEASLSEIAKAAGVTVQAAWGRAERQGWPSQYVTSADGRGARRMRLFPLDSLPKAMREALLAARRGEDPPAIDSCSDCADLKEIAAALGVSYNTAARYARLEEWPFDSRVSRSDRELGRGGPSNLYPLACLPRYVRIAITDRRAPNLEPDEPCAAAGCERQVPGNLLCICGRCGESVCADCMDGEYCDPCRRQLKARRRYDWPRRRKAALALAANRAARGEVSA